MPDVIVLLPGITGSVLKKDGKTVWGFSGRSLGRALFSRGESMSSALSLEGDASDVDDLGDGVVADSLIQDLHLLPGLWKIDGYSKVSKAIQQRFDVTPGRNFFEFPYDWRRDNRVSARALARQTHDWLQSWRESASANAQLILIGHSMGGLVSRYFLEVLEGWKDTRALITFGTPFRGSVNSLDTLANGMKKGPFGLMDLTDMARSFTSIYQLLPTYPAYDSGDGTLLKVGETSGIPGVDASRAADALAFHDEIWEAGQTNRALPEWADQGYDLYPIVGTEQKTNQSGILAGDVVDILTTRSGDDPGGDGTVPGPSAIPRERDAEKGDMYAATKHGSLQNADAVLAHLDGRINDFYLDLGDFRGTPPSGVKVSLEVEDLTASGEPIEIEVRADHPGVALTVELFGDTAEAPIETLSIAANDGEWTQTTLTPQSSGTYRVRVSGPGVQVPAEDALAVIDAPE